MIDVDSDSRESNHLCRRDLQYDGLCVVFSQVLSHSIEPFITATHDHEIIHLLEFSKICDGLIASQLQCDVVQAHCKSR